MPLICVLTVGFALNARRRDSTGLAGPWKSARPLFSEAWGRPLLWERGLGTAPCPQPLDALILIFPVALGAFPAPKPWRGMAGAAPTDLLDVKGIEPAP